MLIDTEELSCPHCQGIYLHHGKVTIYERLREDSETGWKTTISNDGFSAVLSNVNTIDGNPSCRRDGIRIELVCEDCHKKSYLTIAQHKGLTMVKQSKTFPYES